MWNNNITIYEKRITNEVNGQRKREVKSRPMDVTLLLAAQQREHNGFSTLFEFYHIKGLA